MTSISRSVTTVSVTYGTVDVGLFLQEGEAIKYGPLDQASELIANMPYMDRRTLLAPIKDGLIDPQSAYYRINDKRRGQIAICVEDFVHLASSCFPIEEALQMKRKIAIEDDSNPDCAEDDSTVPPRLLDALLLLSDELYSSIDEDCSSGYSSQSGEESRSRGYSTLSEQSGDSIPAIPYSRPPALDYRNRSISSVTVSHQILISEQISHLHLSEGSLTQLGDSKQSEQLQQQQLQQKQQQKQQLQQKQQQHIETQLHEKAQVQSLKLNQVVRDEDLSFQKESSSCEKLLAFVLVAFIMLGIVLSIYFIVLRKATPPTPPVTIYDCVDGSRSLVLINQELRPLVDLKIPEMLPTLTVGNLEYLFMSNITQRKYAQKICTAWCGYLVPINGHEQNSMILELVRRNMPEFTYYWIGLRGWKGSWYMDDESNVTFFNFLDHAAANQNIVNSADDTVEINSGCVQANASGVWSTMYCDQMRPFVCERNTASKNIQKTPFHPYQEKQCDKAGGRCLYDTECSNSTSKIIINLCPSQALNFRCCVPNEPEPAPEYTSSMKTCADVGGICNHVAEDECRNGKVIFNLKVPCPDHPRKLDCCVQNDTAF